MTLLIRLQRWRRTRWLLSAACVLLVIALTTRTPAYADNCSVITDCFGQANTAGEAIFGLSLLAILSLVLDFVPVIGTAKGILEAVTGEDLLTGEHLEPWQRALGIIPWGHLGKLGDVAKEFGRLGRGGDDLAGVARHGDDLAGVARHGDDLTGTARHGDDLTGAAHGADDAGRGAGSVGRDADDAAAVGPHSGAVDDVGATGRGVDGTGSAGRLQAKGDRVPLDPRYQTLVDDYKLADRAGKSKISEQLGELGGLQFLRERSGMADLPLLHPTSADEVDGFMRQMLSGEPWDSAVAFGGKNVSNIVYYDGKTLHVIEAKGGDSPFGARTVRNVPDRMGQRISQSDPDYPLDVAGDMRRSSIDDGRREIGRAIVRAARQGRLEYTGIRTGSAAKIVAGRPDVIVLGTFRPPVP